MVVKGKFRIYLRKWRKLVARILVGVNNKSLASGIGVNAKDLFILLVTKGGRDLMCPKLEYEKELGPVIFLFHIPDVKCKHVTPGLFVLVVT